MRFQKSVWAGMVSLLLCVLTGSPVNAREEAGFERWKHLEPQTQSDILRLARQAFEAYISQRTIITPPNKLSALLQQRTGVFVSAMRQGAPRCCMGTLYPTQPNAALEIIENAVAAAGRDRRFAPITLREAKTLTLIVSIVDKPVPITASEAANLDPTRDGLVVKSGDHYGVVLSGETGQTTRMLQWGRTRAGVRANAPIELFRLQDVRFFESQGIR